MIAKISQKQALAYFTEGKYRRVYSIDGTSDKIGLDEVVECIKVGASYIKIKTPQNDNATIYPQAADHIEAVKNDRGDVERVAFWYKDGRGGQFLFTYEKIA